MKTFNDYLEDIKAKFRDKPAKGLYDATPGDMIEVGFEGSRTKRQTKIKKLLPSDRLQDVEGNIYNKNGRKKNENI
jgi:hypothetical protein